MGLFSPKGNIGSTTTHVGARSEQFIIARLMANGYEVLKPVRDGLRYDVVIEDAEGSFWRIQCKTGRYRNGGIEYNCASLAHGKDAKRTFRTYTDSDCDYFAVYCPDLGTAYLVPRDHAPKGLAVLRVDAPNSRMRSPGRGIRWAKDYEL